MEGWKQGLQRPFILAFFTASSLPASPPRWQQLASDAAGTPILEKVLLMSRHFPGTGFSSLNHRDQDSWRWRELQGSTTDLQPWSVRCVNNFILKASSTRSGQLSPASLLQVPTRPTLLRSFSGAPLQHLGADLGPGVQFCLHYTVSCFLILQQGLQPSLFGSDI